MHVRLRSAVAADKAAIHQLDGLARDGDVERSALIDSSIVNRQCLVAESHHIVGYVVATPRTFFGRDFIDLLMVHDDHRRGGVGRALLRAAVDDAGTSRVFSSTNESNDAMRALFTAEGWTLSGRLDGLDPGDPELVFYIDR